MNGEFGGFTVNGGWLVFLALVALWVALVIESRSRRLSSLLEEALKEAEQLRASNARLDAGPADGEALAADIEQLAAVVDSEQQNAEALGRANDAVHPGRETG